MEFISMGINESKSYKYHAESNNRHLNIQMSVTNPTIWSFTNFLTKIQSESDVFYEQLVTGGSPPKKKLFNIYIDND